MRTGNQTPLALRPIGMRTARSLVLLVAVALAAASCGSGDDAEPAVTLPDTSAPGPAGYVPARWCGSTCPAAKPLSLPVILRPLSSPMRALGLDLFRVTAGESNLLLSPYSIATALSMLYPGRPRRDGNRDRRRAPSRRRRCDAARSPQPHRYGPGHAAAHRWATRTRASRSRSGRPTRRGARAATRSRTTT